MSKPLNIEVRGIGFPNKGAELMLAALYQQIKNSYPSSRVVLPPNAPYEVRSRYGCFQLATVRKLGLDFGNLFRLLPQKMRVLFGVILPTEVDVVIDASGFAYGDQWGPEKAEERLGGNIQAFKSRDMGHKVIMLPQAFGPFTNERLSKAMSTILEHADLVFARDAQSHQHLAAIHKPETLFEAPDFTNLYRPVYGGTFPVSQYPVCFIPNGKMLEMKTQAQGTAYVRFMGELLKRTAADNIGCFVLVHEGEGDLKLAKQIIAEAGVDVPLVQPPTADEVKALIGLTRVVISSRFHGLVSALSQGIPSLATGWSHKYQMLMADYGQQDCLFDEENGHEHAWKILHELVTSSEQYQVRKDVIESASDTLKEKTRDMWERVLKLLESI